MVGIDQKSYGFLKFHALKINLAILMFALLFESRKPRRRREREVFLNFSSRKRSRRRYGIRTVVQTSVGFI